MMPDISTIIPADLDRALERNDVAWLYRVAVALLAEVERTADGAKAIEMLEGIQDVLLVRAEDDDNEEADADAVNAIRLLLMAVP